MRIDDSQGIDEIRNLLSKMKKKLVLPSIDLALETLNAYHKLIENVSWTSPSQIFGIFRNWSTKVSENCRPHAVVCENVALRILKITSDLYSDILDNNSGVCEESLHHLIRGVYERNDSCESDLSEGKFDMELNETFISNLYEELESYKNELETTSEDISRQALQYIHSNETIMVYGYSKTIEAFLKTAAKRRKFKLIVAEGFPQQKGHKMVRRMASTGIDITLIPDSTIFAIMARVNKVIVGSYSIASDGSLCAMAGINGLALSASHHGVPLIVCCGIYKLSPRYHNPSSVSGRDVDDTLPMSPDEVMDYQTFGSLGDIDVINPSYDHVPGNLVTLFITNIGAQSPSYMYRILKDTYLSDDSTVFNS